MKRERPTTQNGIDNFLQRLTKRFGLSEWAQSRVEYLHKNGVPRAEIFRLLSSGRGDPDQGHWSGKYKEGELKEGRTRYRQFKK